MVLERQGRNNKDLVRNWERVNGVVSGEAKIECWCFVLMRLWKMCCAEEKGRSDLTTSFLLGSRGFSPAGPTC